MGDDDELGSELDGRMERPDKMTGTPPAEDRIGGPPGNESPEPGMSWLLPTGLSGDPLLKRLVELAALGWRARLVILSNGIVVTGTLISPAAFREALAASITHRVEDPAYEMLDEVVATAITAQDPEPLGAGLAEGPEPRFVHLSDVKVGSDVDLPFLRLRLPAISGFWLADSPRGENG
jgi:hypothetical protein